MSLDFNIKDETEYISSGKDDDVGFNTVIGCIEDMLMREEFLTLQNKFLEKYWTTFEDNEENKLIYMDIFQEYQTEIEDYIENYLKMNIPGFCMDIFIQELLKKRNELDGEIFDMLYTTSDFLRFKEMFLDYKAMKEGKTADLSSDILVINISSTDCTSKK